MPATSTRPLVPPRTRVARGVALLVAAALYALLVDGVLDFTWTPFLLGLAYLAAAAVGGPRGGLWSTATVLLGWGLGVLVVFQTGLEVQRAAAEVTGVGLGVLAAAALAARGFSVDLVGVGATIVLAGAVFLLQGHVDAVTEPWPYAVLLAAVGAANLVLSRARGARS